MLSELSFSLNSPSFYLAALKDIKYVGKVFIADPLPKSRIHLLKMTSVITLKKSIERREAEVEVTRGLSVYLRHLHFAS